MDRPRYTRQLFFFLLAVLLPSMVLVVFGVLFLRQEGELAARRAEESRASLARDTGRLLEGALAERAAKASLAIARDKSGTRYPEDADLLWLGTWDGGRMLPPWGRRPRAPSSEWQGWERARLRPEQLEFRAQAFEQAAREYVRIAQNASAPGPEALARLAAARSWIKAGNPDRAVQEASLVLDLPSTVRDELGVPVSYFAVDQLLNMNYPAAARQARERLRAHIDARWWSPPGTTYMLRDLAAVSGDSLLDRHARRRAAETELVLSLETDAATLFRTNAPTEWHRYGPEDWLIGAAAAEADGEREVFGIRAPALVRWLPQTSGIQTVAVEPGVEGAYSMRPYLDDAFVVIPPSDSTPVGRRLFIVLGLAVLLSVTLFGGYLLWRDVRRESRLAQLRAHFVSSVSHEFRTPLTSIRMYAESMALAEDAPIDQRRRCVEVITSESERLTRMLDNVLNASRIEQGTMTYHQDAGDLRQAVRSATEAMRYVFEQQGIELQIELGARPVPVMHDADAMEQAVLNLLSNALKYGGGQPVRLTLSTNGSVECVLRVADEGSGIPAPDRERVFERFYRSGTVQDQRIAGAGLGLALVKHIAQAHGGRVELDSAPGVGSTFSIHLPLFTS